MKTWYGIWFAEWTGWWPWRDFSRTGCTLHNKNKAKQNMKLDS